MTEPFQESLWRNFGAAIDMLKNAVAMYPAERWQQRNKFFYLAYHTTIFLDYYLTQPVSDFRPVLPYTIVQEDHLPTEAVDDVMPHRLYSQNEMLAALDLIREKCKMLITESSEEQLLGQWIKEEEIHLHDLCPPIVVDYSVLDILFYNFRHVQHHVAQLNFILRQEINMAPDWVALAES
jgi:hypothetical protein